MATQVSVLKATTGIATYYSTYAEARTNAVALDLIQIWADLTNEKINLKDKVDIWIAPGRIINITTANQPTITDDNIALTCNIFGSGIVKNDFSFGGTFYECIKIGNAGSNVSIVCDIIEGLGGNNQSLYQGVSVLVNATDTSKFSLTCNNIINRNNAAIIIQNMDEGYLNEINIKAKKIETGITGQSGTGTSAMIIEGTGFISLDEVICRNYGSCLIHKKGTITANITKLTTNNATTTKLPTVDVSGGDGTQNLNLYFDEINNTGGGDGE